MARLLGVLFILGILGSGSASAESSTPASMPAPADTSAPASMPAAPDTSAPASMPASAAESQSSEGGTAETRQEKQATETGAPQGEVSPDELPEAMDSAATGDEDSAASSAARQERQLVAYVATGVTVASLAAGAAFGVLAQQQFDCLANIAACNVTRSDPIVGTDYLDAVAEVEHTAVIADMMYVLAASSAIVAVTGYIRSFVITDEEGADALADSGIFPSVESPLASSPQVAHR